MVQQFSSQSTDSFRELLAQGPCSLLISTQGASEQVVIGCLERERRPHGVA